MLKDGIYNAIEQEIVDTVNNVISPETAANTTVNVPVATESAIKNFTEWVDPWNPIYSNDEYAKTTEYGGIIAPPHFLESVNSFTVWPPHPREGFMDHDYAGDYFEYDRPIRVGDRFSVKRQANVLEDVTEEVANGFRNFGFTNNNCDVFDAEGKRVGHSETLVGLTLRDQPNIPDPNKFPYEDHVYTDAEWEYINHVIDQEEIRGNVPRYWEDVNVGDKVPPVSIGPTTIWDMVAFCAARHEVPFHPSRVFRQTPGGVLPDDRTNNTYMPLCWHFDRGRANLMGNARPFNFGGAGANQLLRMATNWMGDSGQVRALNWRHVTRTHHGDCTIGSGRVVKKYKRGSEYCVDIFGTLLNVCRGNLSEVALITVALPTRDANAQLDSQFAEENLDRGFQTGDQVIVSKLPEYYLPSGYPLEGAEGVVQYRFQWQAADFHPFKGYTSVRITSSKTPLTMGDVLVLPSELLEKK